MNTDGFFDGTIAQLQRAYVDSLLYLDFDDYFHVENTPAAALNWCLNEIKSVQAVPPHLTHLPDHRMKTRDHQLFPHGHFSRVFNISGRILADFQSFSLLTGVVFGLCLILIPQKFKLIKF